MSHYPEYLYPWQSSPPAPPASAPHRPAYAHQPIPGHHGDLRQLRTAYRWLRRVASLTALGYFTLFLVLSGFAPGLMGTELRGGLNMGLLLGLGQLPVTVVAIIVYEKCARARVDPLAENLRRQSAAASTVLGTIGIVSLTGYDGVVLALRTALSLVILMFLLAEPLRNAGRFTMGDALTRRAPSRAVRVTASAVTLAALLPLMVVQLAGAGDLLSFAHAQRAQRPRGAALDHVVTPRGGGRGVDAPPTSRGRLPPRAIRGAR